MGSEERRALSEAIKEDSLIPLRVLNSPFPDERARAVLSYAESNSLVDYIIEEYGPHKLGELLSVFALGAHYDDAMMQVFEVDMDGMEDLWRAHIGAQRRTDAAQAAPTVQATATPQPTEKTQPPLLPIAATATAVAAQPRPTAAPTLSADSEPATGTRPAWCGLCPGVLPALALLALWAVYRPRAAA